MGSQVQKMVAGVLSSVLFTAITTDSEASQRYAVGICRVQQKDLEADLHPDLDASGYVYHYQRNNPRFKSISSEDFGRGAKVSVLSKPKLGEIEEGVGKWQEGNWYYRPTKSDVDGTYVEGRDHFVMKVENKGIAVFVHYYIEVVGDHPTTYLGDDGQRLPHFCKRETWKVSQIPDASTGDLAAWQRNTDLSSQIASGEKGSGSD